MSRHVTFHETEFPFKDLGLKIVHSASNLQLSSKLLGVPSNSPTRNVSARSPDPVPAVRSDRSFNESSKHRVASLGPAPSVSNSVRGSRSNAPSMLPPPTSAHVNLHPMVTRSNEGVFKPNVYFSSVSSKSDEVPGSIHEAMQNQCWQEAVHKELQALLQNKTWILCSPPTHQKVVGCKWLF